MSYWDDYTKVEGLEFLGDYEIRDEPYEFDLVGVWRGADGYYVGTDSGCSCPTPWEWLGGDRTNLTGPMSLEDAGQAVAELAETYGKYNYENNDYDYSVRDPESLKDFINGLSNSE